MEYCPDNGECITWHHFAHSVLLSLTLDREKLMVSYMTELPLADRLQSLSLPSLVKSGTVDVNLGDKLDNPFSNVTLRDPEESPDALYQRDDRHGGGGCRFLEKFSCKERRSTSTSTSGQGRTKPGAM